MRLLNTPKVISETLISLFDQCQQVSFAVAWATHGHNFYKRLYENPEKIALGVVGLHFYQTSPDFIETFKDFSQFNFVEAKKGVFHPKTYVFELQNEYALVIGSANLTRGALEKNEEACLLVTVKKDDPIAAELLLNIKKYITQSKQLPENWFESYKEKYKLNKKFNTVLKLTTATKETADLLSKIPVRLTQDSSWSDYKTLVEEDPYDDFGYRLDTLDAIQALLKKTIFCQLDKEDRKFIAGISNKNHKNHGWFGSLQGAGFMKNVVNEHAEALQEALDCIPKKGRITELDYESFIKKFTNACYGQARSPQIATYSRFLTAIRPDFFTPINDKNKRKLKKALSFRGEINADNYWEILMQLHQQAWYQEKIPKHSPDYRLWQYRAAMLDAIFYAY